MQKTGYFPMWFFLKYLQNYRKFIGRKKSQGAVCAALALVPEDVPIDLSVIAKRQTVGRYKRKATGSARVSG